jgi:hypothetical protein
MSDTLNYRCAAGDHQWREEYYGYKCINCEEFIPFGCEPWAPDEAVEQGFAADTPYGFVDGEPDYTLDDLEWSELFE